MITALACTSAPSASFSTKAPRSPVMAVTSLFSRTLTLFSSVCLFQSSRMASRLPASKETSLRRASWFGEAMMCLPRWYLKMVSDRWSVFSNRM